MLKSNVLKREWYIVDATEKVLGRMSSKIARYLMGKHKIEYAPHMDVGDYVIVINSKNVFVSGNKREEKIYYRHTGYVGGLKELNFKWMVIHHPDRIIEMAVKGMLPKSALGRVMMRRLRVYSGNIHVHMAQVPKLLD